MDEFTVNVFPDARVQRPAGVDASAARSSVDRSCYNVKGIANASEHLERLFLRPIDRESKKTPESAPPSQAGYSCSLQLQGGGLAVPRYYGRAHFGPAAVDRTVHGDAVTMDFTGTLRAYQERAVQACEHVLRREHGCLLSAGCSTGKTIMALALATRLGVRTAILVHKGFLLKQWVERIRHFVPGARVGVVEQSTNDMPAAPDVAVCMIQTVIRRHIAPTTVFDSVGLVVVDECHHVCARSFATVLRSFPARYRVGLTATPDRRDGLGYAIPWLLGPLAAHVRRPPGAGRVVWHDAATDAKVVTDRRTGKVAYAATITALLAMPTRLQRVSGIVNALVAKGRQVIVISERRGHLEQLQTACGGTLYVGETSVKRKRERDDAAHTANPLLTTYAMAEEGLDIPRLDSLVLASPRGSPACIEQCVGRIMRALPGKPPPLVVDFKDAVFRNMARERRAVYKRMGLQGSNNAKKSRVPGEKHA